MLNPCVITGYCPVSSWPPGLEKDVFFNWIPIWATRQSTSIHCSPWLLRHHHGIRFAILLVPSVPVPPSLTLLKRLSYKSPSPPPEGYNSTMPWCYLCSVVITRPFDRKVSFWTVLRQYAIALQQHLRQRTCTHPMCLNLIQHSNREGGAEKLQGKFFGKCLFPFFQFQI